jgi:hypothetical protein
MGERSRVPGQRSKRALPDCVNAVPQSELWESVAPHLDRIVRRLWRRRARLNTAETEETFVRNITRQLFEALTVPIRATAKAGCEIQHTVPLHIAHSMPVHQGPSRKS